MAEGTERPTNGGRFSQVVEVRGHIIDSMILPRILDQLLDLGVRFDIEELTVGRGNQDPSYARVRITTDTPERLDEALGAVQTTGAVPIELRDADVQTAPLD